MAAGCEEKLAQIRDLSVTYARAGEPPIHALRGVSLEIRAGEVIGILGESGCGKSTLGLSLLRLLPAYARYDSGQIVFRGQELLQLDEAALRAIRGKEIALIPQDPALALNPVITVGQQIGEVQRAHLRFSGAQRKARVLELLAEVGFDQPQEISHAYPHQLSGGQRQRVAIAQAMACRPALLIADEATSKLDSSLQADIIALLSDIQRRHGMALLFITHDPSLLPGFAHRVVVMYGGQIAEEASTSDAFHNPLHPYTQALVGLGARCCVSKGGRLGERLPAIEGAPADLSVVAAGCRFEPRCSERMEVCTAKSPEETVADTSRRVSCFKYGN
ncbi:MAG TPA: ABC transporter ATP-binding protein [Terriglobales bacterium]|nr:ABC transporter ATP-binding protein [Terriglobales bacterium]